MISHDLRAFKRLRALSWLLELAMFDFDEIEETAERGGWTEALV